jgi:hypothetical protein
MNQDQNTPPTNLNQQVVDSIKKANNVLVTVSQNPSVDQLASCIGLTLVLNKLNKHATAIFSGSVPSTLEFLQPDKTLETNTDSLRDFIISLDRAKADKLRYKVEDNVVRIFITPYRSSLSQNDLVYSQGDFNVDVVIALGVDQREHLDLAIMQQGRILHDAVVIGVSAGSVTSNVGALNMHDPSASSISELVTILAESLQGGLLDEQISTALLTGIVAETDRFRNEKTTAKVMSISAKLMAAGANQQLIAQKIESQTATDLPNLDSVVTTTSQNIEGTNFDVPKDDEDVPKEAAVSLHVDSNAPAPAVQLPGEDSEEIKKIKIDEEGIIHDDVNGPYDDQIINKPHKVIQPLSQQSKVEGTNYIFTPPSWGGTLTAAGQDNSQNEIPNPTNLPPRQTPIINREPPIPQNNPSPEMQLPEVNNQTPVAEEQDAPSEADEIKPDTQDSISQEDARKAVLEAVAAGGPPIIPTPVESLNAQPIDLGNQQPLEQPVQANQNELPPPPLPPPITPMPAAPTLDPLVQQTSATNEQPQPQQGNTPFNLPPPR